MPNDAHRLRVRMRIASADNLPLATQLLTQLGLIDAISQHMMLHETR
jgi:hypothetical protein